MKIKIIDVDGREWWVDLVPDFPVDKLRMMAVGYFSQPQSQLVSNCSVVTPTTDTDNTTTTSSSSLPTLRPLSSAPTSTTWLLRAVMNYRLLLVRTGDILVEDGSLNDVGIQDEDEILLVRRRKAPPSSLEAAQKFLMQQKVKEGPTKDEINEATETCSSPPLHNTCTEVIDAVEFQKDLRSIIITLIQSILRMMCLDHDADEIFQSFEEHSEERVQADTPPDVDERSMEMLTNMGFSKQQALAALLISKNEVIKAMDWLLYQGTEADIDGASVSADDCTNSTCPEAVPDDCLARAEHRSRLRVSSLLKSFRATRRKQFKLNERSLRNLIEMGFTAIEVREALLMTGNNESSACEWLLGTQKKTRSRLSPTDEGLDPDTPVFKAIISNPVVQLYLSSSKNINALLCMLDNPDNANSWVSDPEVGPMLLQISRIYHAEDVSVVGKAKRFFENQQEPQ